MGRRLILRPNDSRLLDDGGLSEANKEVADPHVHADVDDRQKDAADLRLAIHDQLTPILHFKAFVLRLSFPVNKSGI
jgi:hypothetical protein